MGWDFLDFVKSIKYHQNRKSIKLIFCVKKKGFVHKRLCYFGSPPCKF